VVERILVGVEQKQSIKIFSGVILLVYLCMGSKAVLSEELVDRIVAIVDGSPVLLSEVVEKIEAGPLVVISDHPSTDKSPPYERALNDAINWKLATLKADELGVEVEDSDVDREIDQNLKRLQLSRDQLKQRLAQEGVAYEDYFQDAKDYLRLQRFQGRIIRPLIKITDRDLETFYLKKTGDSKESIELQLRQILISIPKDAPSEVVAAKSVLAKQVYQKLVDGSPFPMLAKVYSDDSKARENGGQLPPLKLGDLNQILQSEIQKLEPGQFTPPIKTPMGWYLFFLENKQFTASRGFLANKAKLQDELLYLELQEQTKRWVVEQRRKSKVILINQ
jgi:peptidyl-prolyl cis-trans isomerase SurA